MNDSERIALIKKRHQRLQEPGGRSNGEPGEAGQAGRPAGRPPNRFETAARIRQLVLDAPNADYAELQAAAQAEGISLSQAKYYGARAKLRGAGLLVDASIPEVPGDDASDAGQGAEETAPKRRRRRRRTATGSSSLVPANREEEPVPAPSPAQPAPGRARVRLVYAELSDVSGDLLGSFFSQVAQVLGGAIPR